MSSDTLSDVFDQFVELLSIRFKKGVHTTEDSVRYTFFAAMANKFGTDPHGVVLEKPHPAICRANVDAWIECQEQGSLAIEFKYDRRRVNGGPRPRPMQAGEIFADFRRLAMISAEKTRRLLIYSTDSEMREYFRRQKNGLNGWFDLLPGENFSITPALLKEQAKTFIDAVGGDFSSGLRCLHSCDLPYDHSLRIHEIVQPGA